MNPFKPMLAETVDLEKLRYPVLGQIKWDGIRCVCIPELGPSSRTLKKIPNLFVRDSLRHSDFHHLDGEIVTYTDGKMDDLDVVQSKVMSREGEFDFVYHVFDHIEVPSDNYARRARRLERAVQRLDYCPYVKGVESVLLKDLRALMRLEARIVDSGYEGIILRDPGAAYKFGRSTVRENILLKMKRFFDAEAKVVGFKELMVNGNEQTRDERGYAKRSKAKAGLVPGGVLGALVCEWEHEGRIVQFEIGSGFTAEQRALYWMHRNVLKGKLVTFKYQRVGPKGAPLLPIFKCFRREFEESLFL